jgi:hypothetical protein
MKPGRNAGGMSERKWPQRKLKDESTMTPSNELQLAIAKNKHIMLMTWRYIAVIVSVGVVLVLATPLARAIAGTNTAFSVNVSLALSATFAGTTVTGYIYGIRQKGRADYLERRNGVLSGRVETLKMMLEDARVRQDAV